MADSRISSETLTAVMAGLVDSFSQNRIRVSELLIREKTGQAAEGPFQLDNLSEPLKLVASTIQQLKAEDAALLAFGDDANLSPLEFEGLIHAVIGEQVRAGNPDRFSRAMQDVVWLFQHSVQVSCMLSRAFEEIEGSACSADKSSTVLINLARHLVHRKKIEFNYEGEYTYHLPKKILTTETEIVNWYKAVQGLFFGRVDSYLEWYQTAKSRLN